MKKAIRLAALCTLLSIATFGTVASSSPAAQKQDQLDPACQNACFVVYQSCFFAAYPVKHEMQKCLAEYHHCISHCK